MSNLSLKRTRFSALSTQGELSLDGAFFCYTLEPPKSDDLDVKPRAIPAGTYDFVLAFSPKHGRVVPLLQNVPGFEEIEIHIGNFPKDTLGCILVGMIKGEDAIYQSKIAFETLFPKLSPGAIEITDAPA
jgi:hypothetical protein